MMGIAVARGAAMYDHRSDLPGEAHRYATQTQSYGPSSRTGHLRCDVKISDEEIFYPLVDQPDILVIMSEQAYAKYAEGLKEQGTLIMDEGLVRERPERKLFLVPATKAAQEIGTRSVANVVMLGALQSITGCISYDALKRGMFDLVPEVTHELNAKALERGRGLGDELMGAEGGGQR